MKPTIILALSICAFVSFQACSNNSPDKAVLIAKGDFEQKVTSQSDNNITVTDFQKTNGYDQEVLGQKFYKVVWTAHVKIQTHCWRYGDMVEGFWNNFKVSDKAPGYWDTTNGFAIPKEYQAGDELEFQGEYGLQSTENGWQIADYSLKSWKKM